MVHMTPNRNNGDLKTALHMAHNVYIVVLGQNIIINLFTPRVKLKKKLQCTYNDYHKITMNHMIRMVIN